MILETMLQRLYASLISGPSMNARPHRSRQRCDWMDLNCFKGVAAETALRTLLETGRLEFPARVQAFESPEGPENEWSPEQRKHRNEWAAQNRLLKKLRDVVEDARDYQNDHGESCLAVGFPLLSMPPASLESGARATSRILAPLLLMPVELQVRTASRAGITLIATGEGADRLTPNPALVAWLEKQTGKPVGELFADEGASEPWREVAELLGKIQSHISVDQPVDFTAESILASVPATEDLPARPAILCGAVLGLFPLSNQSLLRDTRWMLENESALQQPVTSFLSSQALHPREDGDSAPAAAPDGARRIESEWLVSAADPCQANAVVSAREARALVVHGPPGTGKSQTITNMIADHLARGERVLFVCDKRTALDVVKYRLDAVGLGDFCGVVHDPGADRKEFYLALRARLENLSDIPAPADPRRRLSQINQQLAALHAELEALRCKIHDRPDPGIRSFHELLGEWLNLSSQPDLPVLEAIPELTEAEAGQARIILEETVERSRRAGYPENPFRGWLGIEVADWLALSPAAADRALRGIDEAATMADQRMPAENFDHWVPEAPLSDQMARRRELARLLREIAASGARDTARHTLHLAAAARDALERDGDTVRGWREQISAAPLEQELLLAAKAAGTITLAEVNRHLSAMNAWAEVAGSFFKRLFAGSRRTGMLAAMSPLGLSPGQDWPKARALYQALRPRLMLSDWINRAQGSNSGGLLDDIDLEVRHAVLQKAWQSARLAGGLQLASECLNAMESDDQLLSMAVRLEAEASWAEGIAKIMEAIQASGLFIAQAGATLIPAWLGGHPATATTQTWRAAASTLEDMVRLRSSLQRLPEHLRGAVDQLLVQGVDAESAFSAILHLSLGNELRQRLARDPALATMDGERIQAAFTSYQLLSAEKLQCVQDHVRFLWIQHQRKRLLSGTGTQLNKLGAGLRQRLFVRGKKALKLRQMLATGQDSEGGDPIYDLCPIWMASPSTVAQIFPRAPIFDVVIFDEASQCRLEEALPVLMRGKRVVVAGDQKQLPPTRFFESGLADSGDHDAETADELFVQQQSDAEDLLSASLNLDVREAYLDVHYRSRNEGLIGFSNDHYYGSRLQPIPGHPRNKALSTPIRIHRVDGVYEERANLKEAAAAVALVSELLSAPNPPSIGLACFNLTQRDALLEALDDLAEKDPEFARRLEEARSRKGRDSFEGLFVKNLENVQGDERDVMIICTTFGPDEKGRFRRNFGALSQREGGRRLNVLVTRAREAVHVFTSIPTAEYRSVENMAPDQPTNGRLQLYAYLKYAETLEQLYEKYHGDLEKMRTDSAPTMFVRESITPSPVAEAFGGALLAQHQTGSHIHWGNDGFCVDVACINPCLPADVTVGVLTDFSRFHKTPDPIEWDIFRTRVLQSQGWELERLWSPVLFRRMEQSLAFVNQRHRAKLSPAAGGSAVEQQSPV
ncbi:MAG: AAA domain-containing protein [Kiritimatiellia bacterium]